MSLNQFTVPLYSKVTFPLVTGSDKISKHLVIILNHEVATLGYSFGPDVLDRLYSLSTVAFLDFRTLILSVLRDLSGGDVRHSVLYNNFPYNTPNHYQYLMQRLTAFIQNKYMDIELRAKNPTVLSCGHVIDSNLFPDLSEFGACPICQQQVPELSSPENVKHSFASVTPLKLLGYADDLFLEEKANNILIRNSSISKTERDFLIAVSKKVTLQRPSTVFKENLPFVYSLFDDISYTITLLSGATDVLRIAYYVSDAEADLSLKNNVKFKISTKHKKNIFKMLESLDDISEDLMRDRERWLRVGELINPRSKKNAVKFHKTAIAFDRLRNSPKDIVTFNRFAEKNIRANNFDENFLVALSNRPGEYARRLDVMLRNTTDPKAVVDQFSKVIDKVQSKMLLEIMKYFTHRMTEKADRVFFPKGNVNKVQIIADTRKDVPERETAQLVSVLYNELLTRQSQQPAMGKVFIDPTLKDMILPFNKRGDSTSNVAMSKGTKYPVNPDAKIIRLFVHWSKTSDVDLSMIMYDSNFSSKGHIAFTRTAANGCVHSGDIQNGYNGASEFIDFDIANLKSQGVRYVITSVISYTGGTFDKFPCFAGFMERDALRSGQRYEPESVAIKFDINAPNTSHCPLAFDLETMQVVFVDLASAGGRYASVASSGDKFSKTLKAIMELSHRKPTVYDLLDLNVVARGERVYDAAEADVVFSFENVDIDNMVSEYLA